MCLMFVFSGQIDWKSWFWKIWVEFKCFWKTFRLIVMHFFFIKQWALRSFCIKMLCFSKFWFFQTFNRSNLFFDQSKLWLKFLVWVYLTWLMFDRSQLKNLSFLCFWPNFFFYASFVFRIHMHCIVFVSILQFCSHISHCFHTTCIHFAILGTQLDQKIDWLIF